MNAGIIILIIFLILLVLAGAGVLIWLFAFRKTSKPPAPPSGPPGTPPGGSPPGKIPGSTGPAAVSYLSKEENYNPGDTIQYSVAQGTEDPIGVISGGIWTSGNTGSYLIFSDITNNGGGGGTIIFQNETSLGEYFIENAGAESTITGIAMANLNFKDQLHVTTSDDPNLGSIAVSDPNPITNATTHFIIEKVNPDTSVLYLLSGQNFGSNTTLTFTITSGTDPIGTMNAGVWTAKAAGNYLVFADATNDGGGTQLTIVKNATSHVGTASQNNRDKSTVTVMGFASLNAGETLQVQTINGLTITNPDTNLTAHLIIQKVENAASYILSAGANYNAGATIQFAELQGTTDPIGQMNNGVWSCSSPGNYLIFSDATNDGGGAGISIIAKQTTIGTCFAGREAGAPVSGTTTVRTFGFATLNGGDTVYTKTLEDITIRNPDPQNFATAHLMLHKIN